MKIDSIMKEGKLPRYKLSKTIQFELKPVGRTMQTFKEKFLGNDLLRASAYPEVKEILDGLHKDLLEEVLSNMPSQEWTELADAYETYSNSDKGKESKNALAKKQTEFRKRIVEQLKKDVRYSLLKESTPKKLFKSLQNESKKTGKPLSNALKTFISFSCYFRGYQDNRLNIYSDKPQATAAANRAINENFPRFLQNRAKIAHIQEKYPSIIADAEKELAPLLKGEKISTLFDIQSYGKYLAQSGIDYFNNILGGYVVDGGVKAKGVNEFINLFKQQNTEAKDDRKLAPLTPLYKQILSDRTSASVIPPIFESDEQALASLKVFLTEYLESFEIAGRSVDILNELQKHVGEVTLRDGIWIDREELAFISKECFDGDWSKLKNFIEDEAEQRFSAERTQKKKKDAIDNWLKRPAYELSEFRGLKEEVAEGEKGKDISELWRGEKCKAVFESARAAIVAVQSVWASSNAGEVKLRERKGDVEKIKSALDAVVDVLHFVKPLHAGEGIYRDEAFYSEFDSLYDALNAVVPLYNKVRNYLTKKPGDVDHIKLMFDNPALASGWDLNNEGLNKCILFFKEGNCFLGVMGKGKMPDFSKLAVKYDTECYRKMVYRQIQEASKYFSIKQVRPQNPPQFVLEWMESGFDKKSLTRDQLAKLIGYIINDFIPNYSSLRDNKGKPYFKFSFKKPSEYESWKEFTDHIDSMCPYYIAFENIPSKEMDKLVEEGKMCLFQLWNKDFSASSTGRPNLHTQYWRAAFDEEDNLKNVVIKLNGEAELFYRPAVIKELFRHKMGEKMVNRRTSDGESIPETIHKEIFDILNGLKRPSELSAEAKKWMKSGKLVIKDVTHDIVKDRRFTEDKLSFHVALTLNAKEPKSPKAFNDSVRLFLNDNPDVNIIGIDRGERNLLYLTLINQKGEILEQCSLNEIGLREGHKAFDYHSKLNQLEKDRDNARKSWTQIGNIKDLKEGYLSQVVQKIARMMIEHNAIVVLEDLNYGFKRGRFHIEKQVYQKFEKALITKLNYLVFKDRSAREPGGVLNAYQLTAPFESFEKLGKQTGFIFYVPAGYTSKIDPTTGFTNLFNTKKCTNSNGIKEFFSRFDSIRYEAHRQAFAFSFDYSNFKTSQESEKKKWTVYTATRRLVFKKCDRGNSGGYVEINPTAILANAISAQGAEIRDGFDLLAFVKNTEPTRENAKFFQMLFYAFDRTLQMRNSCADEDYIESPVLNANGVMFDSRCAGNDLPKDADANGAYHIALKGLLLLKERMSVEGKTDLKIEHKAWFRFVQSLAEKRFCK